MTINGNLTTIVKNKLPSPGAMTSPPTSKDDNSTTFWNMNVPPELHTKECPEYLHYALENEKDRGILSTPDAEYHRMSWQKVQQLINDNRLDLFDRLPSDLRRYREYCAKLVQEYGSIMAFVMQERLQWQDLRPKGAPFCDTEDLKILRNDWPYGIDTHIIHLVVWTKFELASSPITPDEPNGDLTKEARKCINDFVNRTFGSVCGRENVIWFKNWGSLKSIHAVEHFHVMLFNPDMKFVSQITGGDVPLAEKVKLGDGIP